MIQFSGGQPQMGFNVNNQYTNINPNRNYQPFLAQQVVNMLKEEYKDTTIINCVLPNEPHYKILLDVIYIGHRLHEMLKDAEGFVAIDSCLQHFSPSANKAWSSYLGSVQDGHNLVIHTIKTYNSTWKINGMKQNSLIATLETTWLNLN
jgi:hypothetical protein